MRGRIGSSLAGLAAVLAAGCAPVNPGGPTTAGANGSSGPRQCFNAANVTGFQRVDGRTVDLNVGASRIFRVGLIGTCPEVADAVTIGVRSRSGSSFICDDLDVDLVVPNTLTGTRLCPATSLRERTRAELQAERAAQRR